jgi:hypothetical protein
MALEISTVKQLISIYFIRGICDHTDVAQGNGGDFGYLHFSPNYSS